MKIVVSLFAVLFAFTTAASALSPPQAPRMTKEKLRTLLNDPKVGVVDVRQPGDWDASKVKIKGAVRVDPTNDLPDVIKAIPDKPTLVFYCS